MIETNFSLSLISSRYFFSYIGLIAYQLVSRIFAGFSNSLSKSSMRPSSNSSWTMKSRIELSRVSSKRYADFAKQRLMNATISVRKSSDRHGLLAIRVVSDRLAEAPITSA
ncbi:hypothetical protein D3C85_1556150 [compost metagenome]